MLSLMSLRGPGLAEAIGAYTSGQSLPVSVYTPAMEAKYPLLRFDGGHDCFVVSLRWVSMEKPPSPQEPPNQGIRVELKLNRNTVLGPTILYRRQLDAPIYLRANTARVRELLREVANGARKSVDIQLTIHGSVANAPFAALYQVRDYEGEAIDASEIRATPLLQVQPSTPADQWQVAAQASLRVELELTGTPVHLRVVP